MSDLLAVFVLFTISWHAIAVALVVRDGLSARALPATAVALVSAAAPTLVATVAGGPPLAVAVGCAAAAVTACARSRLLRAYSAEGVQLVCSYVGVVTAGIPWALRFVTTVPVSGLTRGLLLAGVPAAAIMLPIGLVTRIETWEVLCRRHWRRPRLPGRAHGPDAELPMVSIHVPCHAEPPALVNATLDHLAALDYPNYEVVVIDNNTTDVALWHPVRDHCAALGERFRFVHVEGITGAKAGALNLVLREHIAGAAQLVAVVDADYHVQPDFLRRLVGHFDDPAIGFVQTPHDYRAWRASRYLRWCYWEYRFFFETTMVALNERDAALTVGTMCLIRRAALEAAGGWAEWCLTEDSELAIRIHAAGYSSVYTTESFGRGLIPETFDGYKKQRHRWTAGPIQELKHHRRMLLDRRVPLTALQRLHHLNHGLDRAQIGASLVLLPTGVAAGLSMLAQDEHVAVPVLLWVAGTVLLVSNTALKWLTYTRVVGATTADAIGASIASSALKHTILMAAVRAMTTSRLPWRRTDKFTPSSKGLKVLMSTRAETVLAVMLTGIGATVVAAEPEPGMMLMFSIGMILSGLSYVAAPLMALMAEADVATRERLSARRRSVPSVPARRRRDRRSAGMPGAKVPAIPRYAVAESFGE